MNKLLQHIMDAGGGTNKFLPYLQQFQTKGEYKGRSPLLDLTARQAPVYDNIPHPSVLKAKAETDIKAKQQAAINAILYKQGQIKNVPQQNIIGKSISALNKGLSIAAHPMTAAAYAVKGQRIPDNFEKGNFNNYDLATSILNPAAVAYSGAQIPGNIKNGDYLQAGLNSLAVLPGFTIVPKATRGLINVVDRNFSKVGKALSTIEREGQMLGLSDFDIARKQLEDVGITANQRQAYIPGVSDLVRKYVTPYGYSGMASSNKLKEVFDNIKKGGIDVDASQVGPRRGDAWRMYLGMPQKKNTFRLAETAPVNHSAYSAKQLKDMDIYGINADALIADELINSTTHATPASIKDAVHNLKAKSFVATDPADVMGNYNARFTTDGLQYNDIWDLNPTIKPVNFLPNKIRDAVDENPLFYSKQYFPYTNSTSYTPRKIKLDIGKFLGKPFMSHGNVNLTASEYKNSVIDAIQNRMLKYRHPDLGDMTPIIERLTEQLDQVNKVNVIKKEGGETGDYKGSSIVDFLATRGYSGKKSFRKDLAEKYGVENYNFSAAKNTELMNRMQENDDLLETYKQTMQPIPVQRMMEMERQQELRRSAPQMVNPALLDLMLQSRTNPQVGSNMPSIRGRMQGNQQVVPPTSNNQQLPMYQPPRWNTTPQPSNPASTPGINPNTVWNTSGRNPRVVRPQSSNSLPGIDPNMIWNTTGRSPRVIAEQQENTSLPNIDPNVIWNRSGVSPRVVNTQPNPNLPTENQDWGYNKVPNSEAFLPFDRFSRYPEQPAKAQATQPTLAPDWRYVQPGKPVPQNPFEQFPAYPESKEKQLPKKNTAQTASVNRASPVNYSMISDATAFNNMVSLGANYAKRQYYKMFGDDDSQVSVLNQPVLNTPKKLPANKLNQVNKSIQVATPVQELPPAIIKGNNLWDEGNRIYHAPEIIDLTRTKWGHRNRGDRTEVNSAGYEFGVIDDPKNPSRIKSTKTMSLDDTATYVGIDKEGKMKVGTGKMFRDKEYFVGRFNSLSDVKGFKRKGDGDYDLMDASGAAANHVSPQVINEKGETRSAGLLIKKNSANNYNLYGNITGGHIIVTSPDYKKQILISGSLTDVDTAMTKFMKDNNLSKVNFVQLDNGSFSRNFKTANNKITSQDWEMFDGRNTSGGSGFFLQGSGMKFGGPIVDPRGQWAHPGEITRIPSNQITMQGVPYPVYAQPNKGQGKMMYPGQDYNFGGASYVDEYPMMKYGGSLPTYQTKGQVGRASIYTELPNIQVTSNGFDQKYWYDKNRTPTYEDSLYNYNSTESLRKLMSTAGKIPQKQFIKNKEEYLNKYNKGVTRNMDPIRFDKHPDGPGLPVYKKPIGPKPQQTFVSQPPVQQQQILQPAPMRQYTGTPVYSPGAGSGLPSALVGFRSQAGDTTFIQPDDYQRFAVPTYGKQYIESQTKRFADGGLLSRSVTCSSCGHSWKSVDGGSDPLNCHNCGGMVKMQKGGQQNLWNTNRTQWVDSIHNARRGDLDFVNRYFDPSAGSIPTPRDIEGWKPGQTSTHLMRFDPGSRRVYPSVVNINGKLQYLPGDDESWNYADDTKEFIEFPTAKQAEWYSNNGYKMGTGVLKSTPNGKQPLEKKHNINVKYKK